MGLDSQVRGVTGQCLNRYFVLKAVDGAGWEKQMIVTVLESSYRMVRFIFEDDKTNIQIGRCFVCILVSTTQRQTKTSRVDCSFVYKNCPINF